jgi:hypothetical protein
MSAECFLLSTQSTSDILRIVNAILMAGKIVRSREDGIAGFASRQLGTLAFVRCRA